MPFDIDLVPPFPECQPRNGQEGASRRRRLLTTPLLINSHASRLRPCPLTAGSVKYAALRI